MYANKEKYNRAVAKYGSDEQKVKEEYLRIGGLLIEETPKEAPEESNEEVKTEKPAKKVTKK